MRYFQKAEGEQNGFAECGTLVHETIEKYLKGELLQCELGEFFMSNFEEAVPNGVCLESASGFKMDLSHSYQKQISAFLEDFSGFTIDGKPLTPLEIEKRFKLLVRTGSKMAILEGIIDVIAKDEEGNLYVIDHKSKKEFESEEQKAQYARQLYIYSAFVKSRYGKYPVKLVFNMFRPNHLEIIGFSEADMNKAMKWVGDTIEEIGKEDLFLPVDFSAEIEALDGAKRAYEDSRFAYDGEDRRAKRKYSAAKKAIEDKLFYCINLCDYRNSCDICRLAREKYNDIVGRGESGKV